MKPIIFSCSKQNLGIGITLAVLLIIFIKFINNHRALNKIFNDKYHENKVLEAFLVNPINKINSLCSIPYDNKTLAQPPNIPTFKPPSISSKPPTSKPPSIEPKRPPNIIPRPSSNVNLTPKTNLKCSLGINIAPPTPNALSVLQALSIPITPDQVNALEQIMSTKPEFVNILASPRKEEIIKEILILNKLVSEPSTTLSQDDINHLAVVILSDINTVDPQIASEAVKYYSGSGQTTEPNIFTDINALPVPDIKLDGTTIQILLSEPVTELTVETEKEILSLFKKIKIDIPYDRCVDMLTGRNNSS